jgi:hypothetical protein
VRQGEGGAGGEGVAGGLEAHAAQHQAELAGRAAVLEPVAPGEGVGEQLGHLAEEAVQRPAEGRRVGDELGVERLVEGQADGRTAAGHGPPPSLTGLRKVDHGPFRPLVILTARSQPIALPQLRDGQEQQTIRIL